MKVISGVREHTKPAKPIPKWLQVRFSQLYDEFGHKEFTLDQAVAVLEESKEVVAVILSRLRQHFWLDVYFDQDDFRKRTYSLRNPSEFFRNISSGEDVKDDKDNEN